MLFGVSKPVIGRSNILIEATIERVFSFVGHDFFDNYPRWSSEVIALKRDTEGPLKVGSQMHQTRTDHGRRTQSTFVVTQFEENQCLAFEDVAKKYRCFYHFERSTNSPDATHLTFIFEFPVLDTFLRPFERMVRTAVQEGAENNTKNIKALTEHHYRQKAVRHQRLK